MFSFCRGCGELFLLQATEIAGVPDQKTSSKTDIGSFLHNDASVSVPLPVLGIVFHL
jgi:hypothetical protein